MHQINNRKVKLSWLLSATIIGWTFISFRNLALGQEIQPDDTLGVEKSVVTSGIIINNNLSDLVTAGAVRGANLFHSFEKFNVGEGQRVYFNNFAGVERIISRVTGGGRSTILGKLGVIGGTADLFLLNPNGIIFGPNASLDLKGSFLATTASVYIFPDSEYSAIEPTFPELSVNVPLGLQLRNTAGEIVNRSRALGTNSQIRVGLQVSQGKTIALVGGNITMEGGGITAPEGRVELGSIVGSGQISLREREWVIGYEGIQNSRFGDINLQQSAFVVSRGNNGGSIDFHGRNINISGKSFLSASIISGINPSSIKITASDSFELVGGSFLVTSTFGNSDGGDVKINAKKIFLKEGSYIQSASSFVGSTNASGNAGNISISSDQIELSDGALINASTVGLGQGGNILIDSSDYVNIFGLSRKDGTPSGVYTLSERGASGQAGNVMINTPFLRIADGATLSIASFETGSAGNLKVNASSIRLNNKASISAETTGGLGNVLLKSNDIILRGNSDISTNATGTASGGNIKITTGLLVGLENSDVTANASTNSGGRIEISSKGIFGLVPKTRAELQNLLGTSDLSQFDPSKLLSSDITAISQASPSLDGQVNLNSPTVDTSKGLIDLPSTVVDPSTLVAQNPCKHSVGSEFVRSGRGGLPPSISQDIDSNTSRVGLVQPIERRAEKVESKPASKVVNSQPPAPLKIVPAQGWIYNDKGQAVLVAYNPSPSGPQRSQPTPASCPAF